MDYHKSNYNRESTKRPKKSTLHKNRSQELEKEFTDKKYLKIISSLELEVLSLAQRNKKLKEKNSQLKKEILTLRQGVQYGPIMKDKGEDLKGKFDNVMDLIKGIKPK